MAEWRDFVIGGMDCVLSGGFHCRLTPAEANEWREFVRGTDEWSQLVDSEETKLAMTAAAAAGTVDYETYRHAIVVHNRCTEAMYDVAKQWFAGLQERRAANKDS